MKERGKYFTEMFSELDKKLTEDSPETDRMEGLMWEVHKELTQTLEDFKVATYGYSSGLRTDAHIRKFRAVLTAVQKAFEEYKKI